MEIAMEINPGMPTYSGGLGVLAGDTLRSAADLGTPLVAFTLLHRKGYFRQHLDADGKQTEDIQPWTPTDFCTEEPPRVTVTVEDRVVTVRAWRYDMVGRAGHIIPIYLLDTDLPENSAWDRSLTDHLYGGDSNYRLQQEIILGMGGVRILNALGHRINVYHMNEGHAALLTLACLKPSSAAARSIASPKPTSKPSARSASSPPTPPSPPATTVFRHRADPSASSAASAPPASSALGCCHENMLNMTYVALRFSRYVNGVALQHGNVSRRCSPSTRSTPSPTASTRHLALEPFQELLDKNIPAWRRDNLYLRNAIEIPCRDHLSAHAHAKETLLAEVASRTGLVLNPNVLTLGFARRAATYKRADLLFTDPERLLEIAEIRRRLADLYAGKAHPQDEPGKALIRRRHREAAQKYSNSDLRVVYLENYDWELGALLTAGVDVWVNTPRRPYEASGTSGMKAALNGVPSLSILDGWWIEGCLEGYTGWAIEDGDDDNAEAINLYEKLENAVVPLYLKSPEAWGNLMRTTIAYNGSFFNTNRMVKQYIRNAYYPGEPI
jgi:starch phosphorylase